MRVASLWHSCMGFRYHEPVILIHGAVSNSQDWPRTFKNKLCEENLQLFSIDLRDSGRNSWTDPSSDCCYSLETMADDVLHFMDVHRIHSAHIIGASMGGAVAQHMAIKESKKIKSLSLLMSTSSRGIWDPSMPQPSSKIQKNLMKEYKLHCAGKTEEALKFRYKYLAAPEKLDEADIDARIQKVLRHGFNPFCKHTVAFERSPTRTSSFCNIQCPTLIIHGKEDKLLPVEHAYLMHENLPQSQLELIEGMAHHFSEKNVKSISSLLINHIRSIKDSKFYL